ncbi:Uncharacterized membrane protein YbhN, UPF0104 family [Thermodesulforhabdus norvegica]|uniref:Uncharacterized membrane protein YbhN, UPF0104 family n=2 Tax=Thermodesulforhabdus norvegica TaxID=39841 RepID=A0A1I4U0I6_9BACT|nr:Uncharacterized membrane protein YbhN, UPF0104 family [Thermodesulforhabdus norvegica]
MWFAAFALFLFVQFLSSLRWKILAESLGIKEGLSFLFPCALSANFFSLFLPGTVTGDVIKLLYLGRRGHGKAGIAASILLDRVFGLFSLVVILGLSPVDPVLRSRVPFMSHLAVVCLSLGALFLTLPLWWERVFRLLSSRFSFYPREFVTLKTTGFFAAFAVSLSCQVISAGAHYIISLGLGLGVTPCFFVFAVPAVGILTAVPVSLHGIGIREGGFVWALGLVGIEPEKALALSITAYSAAFVVGLCGGVVYPFLRASRTSND